MKQTKNWDEYYRCRVRDKAYIDKFSLKYSRFIKEIIFEIKMLAHDVGMPIILKEEGCGIGTVSMAISNMEKKCIGSMGLTATLEIKEVSKVIFSDIDNAMLGLCHKNTCPIYSGGYLGNVPCFYSRENICEPKYYEAPSMVVTHGVLEHFSDDDIMKIISTYDNDNVLFQAHYVPTNRYTSPSFGDERLLTPEAWSALVKPDYYIMDNNGYDLYMFKSKRE